MDALRFVPAAGFSVVSLLALHSHSHRGRVVITFLQWLCFAIELDCKESKA